MPGECMEVRTLEEWYLRRRFKDDSSLDVRRYANVDDDDNRKNISKFRLCGTPHINMDLMSLIDKPQRLTRLKKTRRQSNAGRLDLSGLALGVVGRRDILSRSVDGSHVQMKINREAPYKVVLDVEDSDAVATRLRRMEAMQRESENMLESLKRSLGSTVALEIPKQKEKIKREKYRLAFIKLKIRDVYKKLLLSAKALMYVKIILESKVTSYLN